MSVYRTGSSGRDGTPVPVRSGALVLAEVGTGTGSGAQAEMLTLVLLNPGREWTMTDLASRVGSAVSSVQREVVRAEQAGVMSSRRVGKTRLVTAARSPLTGPLTELLLRSFGPRQVLAEELADVPGVEKAYLFGSWAAGYAGQWCWWLEA
jgi:hypothetical protein